MICPLLMQARASMPDLQPYAQQSDSDETGRPWNWTSATAGPLYPDPSTAPGVGCIGSRCAWWVQPVGGPQITPAGVRLGRCGQVGGPSFADPAGGAS